MDPTSEMYNYISANSPRLPQTPQPLDCSSRILDLCVRRRTPSPQPFKVEKNNNLPVKQEAPSSPCAISSCSPVSDISPMSTSPNPFYEIPSHINIPSPTGSKSRLPRPFKAYPKDPLTMATGINAAVFDKESAEAYAEFRKNMLYCVQGTNGMTNKNMRRATHASSSSRHDPIYWEKRRKNNEAAKKSRDARRAKEDEIAIRAAFLEQENIQLKYTLASVKNELNELKRLVYNRSCVKITGPYMGVEYNS